MGGPRHPGPHVEIGECPYASEVLGIAGLDDIRAFTTLHRNVVSSRHRRARARSRDPSIQILTSLPAPLPKLRYAADA
jgi:hypothetical protein